MGAMKPGITKPRKFTQRDVKPAQAWQAPSTGMVQTLGANDKQKAKKELMAKQGAITEKNKARRAKGVKGKPAAASPTPRQVTALPPWKR